MSVRNLLEVEATDINSDLAKHRLGGILGAERRIFPVDQSTGYRRHLEDGYAARSQSRHPRGSGCRLHGRLLEALQRHKGELRQGIVQGNERGESLIRLSRSPFPVKSNKGAKGRLSHLTPPPRRKLPRGLIPRAVQSLKDLLCVHLLCLSRV
jgi:hypothetical protein